MPPQPKRKGEPRMKRLLVLLPEEVHTRLKVFAAENQTTVREVVTRAVLRELERGGKKG
jgi:hypothetical protein